MQPIPVRFELREYMHNIIITVLISLTDYHYFRNQLLAILSNWLPIKIACIYSKRYDEIVLRK